MLRIVVLLALAGALTSPAARRLIRTQRQRRQERAAVEARSARMGDFCAAASRRLSGGDTLLQALGNAAGDGPMSGPLGQVTEEHERGVTLSRAVQRWAAREQTSEAALLSTAVTLASDRVGAQPQLFDRVASICRTRADMAAEARVQAAQARASIWVVAALPWAVALALLAEGGAAARVLVSTPLGWFCIGAALLAELAGVAWMRAVVARALR
ncbi:type II secretion system F family protein [Candidatus Poriferisodalis sp.]|uniref:type II secretion system F family protein n=1 Tax=Candidatus Poriferisodalis sp. TaxID=3101277 RepID=UPI003B0257AF